MSSSIHGSRPSTPNSSSRGTFDTESQNPTPSRRRMGPWGWGLTVGGLAAVGGITGAAVYFSSKHGSPAAAPSLTPPAPAPLQPKTVVAPPPPPVVTLPPAPPPVVTVPPAPPPPANNNITGFLNVLPFTMAKNTALYTTQSDGAGNQKYAVVLTDAYANCQGLTAGPVRGAGVQELDLCEVTNSNGGLLAENGRIVQYGSQYPSTALSLQGNVDSNGVLNGQFTLNTTNVGYVTGNFAAQPCNTLVYTNFCDLQNK